ALCEKTVAQILKRGGEAKVIQTDVTEETQVKRLIAEAVKHIERLDILVNNAGIGGGGRIAETTTDMFDRVMNINLRGTFFCCREEFRQMMKNEGGSVLELYSSAPVQSWY